MKTGTARPASQSAASPGPAATARATFRPAPPQAVRSAERPAVIIVQPSLDAVMASSRPHHQPLGTAPLLAPRVLNKYTDEIDPDAVWIMRSSKWGNPFLIGTHINRQQAVNLHREWLQDHPELAEAARAELRGRNLVCCCAPKACHGDTLLKIANSTEVVE